MITVLNVKKQNARGIKGLISGIRRKGEIKTEIKSGGEVRVKYVEYVCGSGKPDWRRIAGCVGQAKGYLLCKRELQLPYKLGFKRFHSLSLSRLMAINGALRALSVIKAERRRVNLCFCDMKGEYIKYAPLFLPMCAEMKIISKSESYEEFPEYAMGEYGACVELCRSAEQVKSCNIFVSPRFAELDGYRGCDALMFTAGGASKNQHIRTVNGYSWRLPAAYRKLKPEGMSSEYFSQALYSIAGVTEMAKTAPHAYRMGGAVYTTAELCGEIESMLSSGLDRSGSKAYN